MATVFVAGAGGLIGEAVAVAFRNAGYRVYGLVRKEQQANLLAVLEILPIIGNLDDLSTYGEVLKKASVVVDATGTNTTLLNAVIELNKNEVADSRKQILIGTSGTGLFDSGNGLFSEQARYRTDLPAMFEERAKATKLTLSSPNIRGNIVHPGAVLGSGVNSHKTLLQFAPSFAELLFAVEENQEIVIYGKPNKVWGWIHVNDLANIYLRIAETEQAHQEFFGSTELISKDALVLEAARISGWKGKVKYQQDIPETLHFEKIFDRNIMMFADKATRILNWHPKHTNILYQLDIQYNAWKANDELHKKLNQK